MIDPLSTQSLIDEGAETIDVFGSRVGRRPQVCCAVCGIRFVRLSRAKPTLAKKKRAFETEAKYARLRIMSISWDGDLRRLRQLDPFDVRREKVRD